MNWQKLELAYEEFGDEGDLGYRWIDQVKTFEKCVIPFALKLKSGEVVYVGNVNKNFGRCDCCSDFAIQDIEEFANISVRCEMKQHNLSEKFYFKGVTKGNRHIVDGKEVMGNLITDRFNAVISTSSFSTTMHDGIIEVDGCFFVDPETVELVRKAGY